MVALEVARRAMYAAHDALVDAKALLAKAQEKYEAADNRGELDNIERRRIADNDVAVKEHKVAVAQEAFETARFRVEMEGKME